jgi:hypothetical protein
MTQFKDYQKFRFISDQKDATYTLTIEAISKSGGVKSVWNTYQVTELIDTYGYLHRYAVKEKVIDDFLARLNKVL